MIDFEQYQRIHQLHREGLSDRQIAGQLRLRPETVAKWRAAPRYAARKAAKRPSRLDPYRAEIVRLLHEHPYSAQQIFQRLKQQGYPGGHSILTDLIRQLRPPRNPAFLSLKFLPAQCTQIDWGHAGRIQIGSTFRAVSFLVMVHCYSRKMYVEFTLSQAMDAFLSAQQNGFLYFGGLCHEMMVDNCKTAVLAHPTGGPPTFHPRYIDFAQHWGFQIKACSPRQPQQKGRVESAVAYIKGNFLNGLQLHSLESLNQQVLLWLNTVANVRIHSHTQRPPEEMFREEIPKLRPLHPQAYEACQYLNVQANNRARVIFETNRYSVPPRSASQRLVLKAYPDRLMFFDAQNKTVAVHRRVYDRHQDVELPEHLAALEAQRRQGRHQQQWVRFVNLSPVAEAYYQALEPRRENPRYQVLKILALAEHYGVEAVDRALRDAQALEAYGSEYIANILHQRSRPLAEPGVLHLTRASDQLELELPPPDLSVYQAHGGGS